MTGSREKLHIIIAGLIIGVIASVLVLAAFGVVNNPTSRSTL